MKMWCVLCSGVSKVSYQPLFKKSVKLDCKRCFLCCSSLRVAEVAAEGTLYVVISERTR